MPQHARPTCWCFKHRSPPNAANIKGIAAHPLAPGPGTAHRGSGAAPAAAPRAPPPAAWEVVEAGGDGEGDVGGEGEGEAGDGRRNYRAVGLLRCSYCHSCRVPPRSTRCRLTAASMMGKISGPLLWAST